MSFDRRKFLKAGAAGVAGALQAAQIACARAKAPTGDESEAAMLGGALTLLLRGLSLIEYQAGKRTFVVHMLDATKFGMPAHAARLRVDVSAIDQDATSVDPTEKDQPGTSKEAWLFDLKGQTVAALPDADPADADYDTSVPAGESPVLGNWKSMKWVPNLGQLTGATTVTADSSFFVCNITLPHGNMRGEEPHGKVGAVAKWTFRKPAGGAQITKQQYSDTVRYRRALKGRTPVITIGSGKVVLKSGAKGDVVIENAAPPPEPPPASGAPITLGHFPLFYKVVDAQWEPEWTVEPPEWSCKDCEGDPIFCPPSWGRF